MVSTPLVIPHLRGCAWFEEEVPGLAPGTDGCLEVGSGPPDVAFVEPMVRRRLSRMARGFFHCAQRLAPPADARVVFASRHGEAERTLGLLRDLAAGREVSPAAFSMSVHNAVPGLWSILKGDHAPVTALAAGAGTFGWGLAEACGQLAEAPADPVLFVYAEDRLPEPWAEGAGQPGPHAVALLLGGGAGPRLTFHRLEAPAPDEAVPEAHRFLQAWRAGAGAWGGWQGRFQ